MRIMGSILLVPILLVMIISGCADSPSSSASGTLGVPVNKTVYGVITGFGSIFVNGVEFETTNSDIMVDGSVGAENSLKLGMFVAVDGTVNANGVSGDAIGIRFNDELEGPVIANNLGSGGSLNVMGQMITIDNSTVFESKVVSVNSVLELANGNIVEVSGHSSGNGSILATRIELKSLVQITGQEIEVKGVTANTTATTFTIGQLVVDYNNALLDGFVNSTITDGLYVEAKSITGLDGNGQLVAYKVELASRIGGNEGEHLELEGIVTSIESTFEFSINGISVLTTDSTIFIYGNQSNIVLGQKIEVHGVLNVDGIIIATKVEFKQRGEIKFDSYVSSVNVAAGTVSVFDRDIKITNLTLMEDRRDNISSSERTFGINELSVNDRIEIRSFVNSSGDLQATRLRRYTDEMKLERIHGPVTEIVGNIWMIGGVSVDVSASISLPAVNVGTTLVEGKGSFSGGVFTATEMHLANSTI